MDNYNGFVPYDNNFEVDKEAVVRNVITKTYLYMFLALLVSGVFAFVTYTTGNAEAMLRNGTFYILIVIELVVVFAASAFLKRNMVAASALSFTIYSIINGITLSFIFLAYEMESIKAIFFISAAIFGIMAFVGHTTKKDLTSLGSLLLMALLGIILVTIINVIFLKSEGLDLLLSYVGVLIFVGLTAFDAQRIKKMALMETSMSPYTIAMLGALNLYLDFINIFLYLLRIFGRRN